MKPNYYLCSILFGVLAAGACTSDDTADDDAGATTGVDDASGTMTAPSTTGTMTTPTTGVDTTTTTGEDTGTGSDTGPGTGTDTGGDTGTDSDTGTGTGTGTGTESGTDSSTGGALSFEEDIQPIFNTNCSCHIAGIEAGLNLQDAYDDLVNVPATQADLDRVEPGDPAASYLFLKLTDAHVGAGGEGGRMPLGGGALPRATIDLIEDWILAGAPV
jgi:hypothetical protein